MWTKENSSSSVELSSKATRRRATKSFAVRSLLKRDRSTTSSLWEVSLLRLNQLGYFEPLEAGRSERHRDAASTKRRHGRSCAEGQEKGKNSIGLQGGVSGLAGAFIGLSYTTNNFLGLGETLQIQASIGNRQRDLLFGFTEPYLYGRPMQFGFTVYTRKYSYDQAQQYEVFSGQKLNLSTLQLQNLQNYSQSSTGFSLSLSYPLHRSFKRVGIIYSYRPVVPRGGQRCVESIVYESRIPRNYRARIHYQASSPAKSFPASPSIRWTQPTRPTAERACFSGPSLPAWEERSTSFVRSCSTSSSSRCRRSRNAIGYNVQASFLTGYGGVVAPPFERFYLGGDNDLRGFDIRSISPIAFLPDRNVVTLTNPDGSQVPLNPNNPNDPRKYQIPIPFERIVFPGGDLSLVGNLEYRFTIAGPVAIAPFVDMGINPIVRTSQLRINSGQLNDINSVFFGCPALDPGLQCSGGQRAQFSGILQPVPGTNWVPRMSTGLELQVMLPVINAPFRIYWAYNPLRLDTQAEAPVKVTREMFPAGAAGDFTFQRAVGAQSYTLREPRKTFRFSVATTF